MFLCSINIQIISHFKIHRAWQTPYSAFHPSYKKVSWVILSFKVPIVKLTDKRSNIKVDISFNMDTAVKGAELIQVCFTLFNGFILVL